MKKITIITLAIILSAFYVANAQNKKKKTDNFVTKVDLYTDLIQDQPEGLDVSWFNRGVNIYFMYSFPIKNTPLDIEIGTGIGNHNMYHDNFLTTDADGVSQFISFNTKDMLGKPDKAKLGLTYIDVPFELHYGSEKDFNVSVGFKVGMLINSVAKYKGELYKEGEIAIMKQKRLENINTFRAGPTFRIGYKWINLYAYYSLTTFFEENKGPEIFPISVGLAIGKF